MGAPFFSIGVTTYDRVDLLLQTVDSILCQTFYDFEIIISNDNPNRIISLDTLKTDDARIRIINQRENLGEYENMNSLLSEAKGEFFTWLADDDLYASNFLEEVYVALIEYANVPCVFSSYGIIEETEFLPYDREYSYKKHLFSGSDFLNLYAKGSIRVIGVMGVFNRNYLLSIGGLDDVSNDNKGLYCEYMIIVQTGLLDKICYIDSPLIYYRNHKNSWGCSNIEVELYKRAGRNFVNRSINILQKPELSKNYRDNINSILMLVVSNVDAKLFLINNRRLISDLLKYIISLLNEIKLNIFTRLYFISVCSIMRMVYDILVQYLRNRIKGSLSYLYRHLLSVIIK